MSFKKLLFFAFFSLIIGTSISFAQRDQQTVFKRANAKMITAVHKHLSQLKANPYILPNNLRHQGDGAYTEFSRFLKAYDLNPNDLSLKIIDWNSTYIIIFPTQKEMKNSERLSYDILKNAKVSKRIASQGIITELNYRAAFIMKKNELGNFEIQDLMSRSK